MKILVKNVGSGGFPKSEVDIYVGRYNSRLNLSGSCLGNPFVMREKTDAERQRVLQAYKLWLWNWMKRKDSMVYRELERIAKLSYGKKEIRLWCWCAPQPCHGDIIKAAIEWMAAN